MNARQKLGENVDLVFATIIRVALLKHLENEYATESLEVLNRWVDEVGYKIWDKQYYDESKADIEPSQGYKLSQ